MAYTKARFDQMVMTVTAANGTTITTPFVVKLTSLKYTSETDWPEVTDNSTPHKQYEPGYRGLSGSLEGFYDTATAAELPFSDGDSLAVNFKFNATDMLTLPNFCVKNVDVSGDPGSPQLKLSSEWMVSAGWTQTTGTTTRAGSVMGAE
jgi:hypothetical protein